MASTRSSASQVVLNVNHQPLAIQAGLRWDGLLKSTRLKAIALQQSCMACTSTVSICEVSDRASMVSSHAQPGLLACAATCHDCMTYSTAHWSFFLCHFICCQPHPVQGQITAVQMQHPGSAACCTKHGIFLQLSSAARKSRSPSEDPNQMRLAKEPLFLCRVEEFYGHAYSALC